MFVAGVILSNLILPERFGTISLIILNASLLSILTGLGADSIVLHKVSNKEWSISKAEQFTWYGIAIQVILFIVFEFASLLLLDRTVLSNASQEFLLIDILYFVGLLLTEKQLALLYSYHRSLLANAVLALVGIVYLLSLFFIGQNKVTTATYFFAFQSFIQGITLVILFKFLSRLETYDKLNYRDVISALKLSSIVMITNVIQLMAYRMDFWLLKYFYSNYEVGVYAQANKFANLVWIVPNILAQLLIPRFSVMGRENVPRIFSAGFYFNLISILATIVCANFFYFYYLNEAYQMGLTSLYLMLPGYFFWATVIYFGAYFSWAGRFYYNLFASICCFVLIAIADFNLIPRFGLEGAAIANTITYFFVFLLYYAILIKKYSFKWRDLLLLNKKELSAIIKLISK
jgi:O-antigen/teichoic acid export membrane protein